MPDVVSTKDQLVRAYKAHKKYSDVEKPDISHLLLLFYAVECGLKAMYLQKYNLLNTSSFETSQLQKKWGHGHDLLMWCKDLKIPGNSNSNEQLLTITQLHEKLRYGVYSGNTGEKSQIDFIKFVLSHIKSNV